MLHRSTTRSWLAGASLLLLISCAPAQRWGGPETWAFPIVRDDFRSDALLDLRFLNEKEAGETGFIRVSPEGGFLRGNGEPIRFWAVNSYVGREINWTRRPLWGPNPPDLARNARFLAKRGVNMNRLHTQISPNLERNANAPFHSINEDEREWIWRSVAAMKKEGIYTTLSPYWGVPMKFSASWNYPGGTDQSALGLLFFEPKLQGAYKEWLRQLLTVPNPHTGLPLGQDPAVAIFQIQNEDSLLFWTVNNIRGPNRELLERKFGDFVRGKYGSLDAAFREYGGRRDADNPSTGRLELQNIWELTQQRTGGVGKRIADQAEFYARTMFDFNREIARFLREDLGVRQIVNANNWKPADILRLGDLERWTYTANEVDAVNRYFSGIHRGPNEGWAIQNGDKFTNRSVFTDPKAFPISLKQTPGRPMLVTESAWVMPNAYASEGPFLIAAYQSLTGVDGYYWFAMSEDEWTPPQSANGYNPSQGKWIFATPDMLGTFPAAALMFRQGYLKQGTPVVVEHRALDDLWNRRTPIIAEESGFDPNRDSNDIAPRSAVRTGVDPLAFFVGPVHLVFDSDPAQTTVVNLERYIDKAQNRITSVTGEVVMDLGRRFCTVDAPSAQGVTGFFDQQRLHRLTDVTFSVRNDYGSFLAVSLDGEPLKSSRKVLVQVGTRSRPTDWEEVPADVPGPGGQTVRGFEVRNYGRAPWQVVKPQAEVIVRNPSLRRGAVLDMNGNSVRNLQLTVGQSLVRFSFPEDAMYVVLQP